MREPTIRVESCRGDGRCPECGNFAPPAELRRRLSCLCETHADCTAAHANALLTEALRQRDACQSGVCSEIEMLRAEVDRLRHWREDESANFGMSREVCAALREERDAAIREVARLRMVEESQTQSISTSAMELYKTVKDMVACEQRAEKAEATVARQAQRIQQQEVAWSASQARAEKAEALLRGALGQLEVALQDWTGHIPVGWVRQTHTLLSEIREFLPK